MLNVRPTHRRLAGIACVIALVLTACGDDDGPTVTLTAPTDDAHIAGGVQLAMSADGLTIEEAGEVHDDAGHFHVIADDGCTETGAAVARDADHVHFGKGQSEGVIYLEPGAHELCLQAGDGEHIALDATDTVSIQVGIADQDEWCAVIGEVDVLFDATDNNDDEFAVKQVAYEGIRRLLVQLEDGLDQIDAAVREDISATLAFAANLVNTLIAAEDEAAAREALEELFEGVQGDDRLPGAQWISDNCGVDVD